jgi:P4 family phage/plasmid primase-like protien
MMKTMHESPTFSADQRIVAEHGPKVDLSGKSPKLNHPSIAAAFANRAVIVFDAGIDGFRQFDAISGLWHAMGQDKPTRLLAGFMKGLADELHCSAILPMRTSGSLGAILNLMRGMAVMGAPDVTVPRIHAANGVVEFLNGKPTLRPRRPEDCATTCSPVDFVPEAKAPRFLEGLIRPAVPYAPDVDLLQRWFGAVLLGRNDAQRLLLLHGEGESGKSTFVTIVEHLLGLDHFAELRTAHLGSRFETQFFQGKTFLAAKDVPPDTLQHKGAKILKSLTGGDLLEPEKKFGGKTRMRGCFNVVVTSNGRLLIALADDESAWIRRLLIVEFRKAQRTASIANFDTILLREEGAGILAWGIEGAAKLLAELKGTGNYILTPEQQRRVESVVLESRSVEEFVAHCVVARAGADIAVEELHAAYLTFCAARGWMPVTTKTFQVKSPALMVACHGSHRTGHVARGGKLVRGFKSVALKRPPNGSSKLSTDRNRITTK